MSLSTPKTALAGFLSLCVLVGALALAAPAALAAAPETPTLEPAPQVTATSALIHGVLNPGKEGGPGEYEAATYEFVYRPSSKNECKGAGEATTAGGLSLGAGKEEVAQALEGLTVGTEYAVCLVVHNQAHTATAASTPLTFTTTIPPATPTNEEALEVTLRTAKLKGILNAKGPGNPGNYHFSYAPSETDCEALERENTAPTSSNGLAGEVAEATVSDLLPGTTYTFCLIADNAVAEQATGAPITFTTPVAAPTIANESTTTPSASAVEVSGEISPESLSTTYFAEFVTAAEFQAHEWSEAARVPLTDAGLPAGRTAIPVREDLSGLQAGTGYRFRFVATNSLGTVFGASSAFTTASSGVASATTLPDGRAYELVSTSGNAGEPFEPLNGESSFSQENTGLPFEASATGEAMTYVGEPGSVGGTGQNGAGFGIQWLAKRTPSGWQTSVISPANTENSVNITSSFPEGYYQAFSSDLASGIVQGGPQPLSAEVPEHCHSLYSHASGGGAYQALFVPTTAGEECGQPLFAGASLDQSQVIFQSEAALTANAVPATEVPAGHEEEHFQTGVAGHPCMFGCNLYHAANGELSLVNVLEGHAVANATFGGYGGAGQKTFTNFSNAISTDGSRIFWTDTQEGPDMEHVYVQEDGTTTVPVSGSGPAEYWTATPDGVYAYYTEAGALWRFDTRSNTRDQLVPAGAEAQGVIGVNAEGADGSYLYFVAEGELSTTKNANGELPTNNALNLYLRHEGVTSFVATLDSEDNPGKLPGDLNPNLGRRVAQTTPDGRHLVFESVRRLTSYDNAPSGQGIKEVYLYDASDAQLTCASCNPTGAPPTNANAGDSRLIPSESSDTYMHRWISADGSRVFFNSPDALTPQDDNGTSFDAYEWEREGSGTCTTQSPPRLNRGCVSLLSGGNSEYRSLFVDADATGDNAFIEHVGPLGQLQAPLDHNELYDVRVDGGFPQAALSCTGTGCQSAPAAAPSLLTPPSVTFSGLGNFAAPSSAKPVKTAARSKAEKLASALKACRRDKSKKKRTTCEKRARAKLGAKKASDKRRAK
jgi:hypothetical protein